MNFNTAPALWRAELASFKDSRSHLYVNPYGSIWRVPANGRPPERIGQFDTTDDAVAVLIEAGWIKSEVSGQTIYTP